MSERITFEEAISDGALLKDAYDTLSWPQKITLRAFYGLPLSGGNVNPATGYSELDYWSILQGNAEYDDLGYPTKVHFTPYVAKEYNQLWAVAGRRMGKTSSLGAFVMAYEAVLGGHQEYISSQQECIIFLVAHKLPVAQANIKFVLDILDKSPILKSEITNILADKIEFRNGLSIQPSPPSLKAQRGLACPVVVMDEVAFWYSDPDAANPDVEVERAIAKSQLQFPHYKRVGISSPWTKEGLLWKYHKAGTEGIKLSPDKREPYIGKLATFCTTAAGENPALIRGGGRARLREDQLEDPDSFERECLCRFPDAISGFIGKAILDIAAKKGTGVAERAPVDFEKAKVIPMYVAAMDPAFRRDSFGFCILHKDIKEGIVVDAVRKWTPLKGQKLNPKDILAQIKPLLDTYNINLVYTDQYQLETLQELAWDMGIGIEGVDFTNRSKAKIFGNLSQLINQGKLVLLDPDLSEDAGTMYRELSILERRMTPTGAIQISAPEGKHDDMATVLALAAVKAVWMAPEIVDDENKFKEPTIFERVQQTLERRKQISANYN